MQKWSSARLRYGIHFWWLHNAKGVGPGQFRKLETGASRLSHCDHFYGNRFFQPSGLSPSCRNPTRIDGKCGNVLLISSNPVQELRCVRVLDPIPTKPSCVVSVLDDSGLRTLARTDEL